MSISDEDVAFLDEYARATGAGSRSAAVQRAIQLLRHAQLSGAYEAAWIEWAETGEADAWDATVADGMDRS
ncbi:Antitoxin MazE9 [compost metagenome]